MTQRGRGQIDMTLDLARRGSTIAALNDEAKHSQPHRVSQRSQLFSVSIELSVHALFLVLSKQQRKH
jgi:hypothetical protein